MSKYNGYLMNIKAWDENGEPIFYTDIASIYKKGDHFVLEGALGDEILVPVKDDNILEVS